MSRALVTVKTLVAQLSEQGRIDLPAEALITPAAADWLQSCRVPVQQADAAPAANPIDPTLYVIGDPAQPAVRTLLPIIERRHDDVRFLSCNGRRRDLLTALGETCAGLAEDGRRRGLVLVNNGAITSCVTNKHAHVRAAIASKPSSLYVLLRELGINLLICEIGRVSIRQMQAMIEGFLAGPTNLDPLIAAAVNGTPAPDDEPCECGGST